MKVNTTAGAVFLVLLLCFCAVAQKRRGASARAAAAGSICIAALPGPNSGEISLANAAGGNRSFGFSIQVDEMPPLIQES